MIGTALAFVLRYPRLVGAFAILVALSVAFAAFRSHYIGVGEDNANQKVEEQNNAAVKRADEAGRTAAGCYDSGGVWDVTTGHCRRR